ncbi:MAG: cation:proton antiporter [Candidatus Woesearchaeota archaeon]
MDIFFQIGIMFIVATAGAYIARLMKQPIIPAYIITGIILGPVLGIITSSTIIKTLSEIGIAFLLFIVGLELNLKNMKETGRVAVVTAIVEVLLVAAAGFWVAGLLGYAPKEALYIGFIIALSSTMVVIKLLSDKRELDTLHGRIIIGILLVQDFIAIFALSFLSELNGFVGFEVAYVLLKAGGIIIAAYLIGRFIFPSFFRKAAESQELLLIVSLGVCFLFSIIASHMGFSIAIGAFIAGVSLANLPYRFEIIGRVRSLRYFFAALFFVSLGLEITLSGISDIILPMLVFLLMVIILKPLVFMIMSALFRYTKRTSFQVASSLAQVSEFSLILAAQGLALGHISNEIFSLTVLLAIITITMTSYLIKFEMPIFNALSRPLSIFDIKETAENLEYLPGDLEYDVVLIGYDRIGYNLFKMLKKQKKSFIVIDFNPDIIRRMVRKRIPCIYGDIGDPEILERLNLRKTKLVISTVPELHDSKHIIKKAKRENPEVVVFTTASIIDEALDLYKEGADYVILPHFLGGEKVSTMVQETAGDHKKLNMAKLEHIDELKRRIDLEHEHPKKA